MSKIGDYVLVDTTRAKKKTLFEVGRIVEKRKSDDTGKVFLRIKFVDVFFGSNLIEYREEDVFPLQKKIKNFYE